MGERGQLPKAYLRLDPNVDQSKPGHLATFIRLMCAAHRQPVRGRFKSRRLLEQLLGKANAARVIAEGDVVQIARSDAYYMVGWDEWQEGDITVGERQRRIRSERAARSADVTNGSRKRNGRVTNGSLLRRDSLPAAPAPLVVPTSGSRSKGHKGREAANNASPLSPVEIAVDALLAPRTGTLAQHETMVELAEQLGVPRVVAVLESAMGEPNGYGVALGKLTDAARRVTTNGAERLPGEAPNPRHEGQHPDCFVCGTATPAPKPTARPRSAA